MLEGQYRTADQRLTELVTEVRSAVRGLGQDLLRGLIQPLTNGHDILPVTGCIFIVVQTRIGGHINSCTSDRP